MADDTNRTEADAIAEHIGATVQALGPKDRYQHAMVPPGWGVESLEHLQAAPDRARGDHVFRDTVSLALYLHRYLGDADNLFVTSDRSAHELHAVLNYHEVRGGEPGWGDHKATFRAAFTAEYEAWRKMHRRSVSQIDMAEFLEDRSVDIIAPAAADVMEMVMRFEALKSVSFGSAHRLKDGSVQLLYDETVTGKGSVTIPDYISIFRPIYEGQEPQEIKIRFRYKIDGGSLRFALVIAHIEEMERQAFQRCEDGFLVAVAPYTPHLHQV